ncbi:MAG: GIY-YIG nuclease family protein [Geitlerinemataceae cyanobacterium]
MANKAGKAKRTTKQTTDDDLALLEELGVEIEAPPPPKRTPREERIIAGFEDIDRFVEESGRLPQHGDDRDIFERMYAVRLERLRELAIDSDECRALLEPLDTRGLLSVNAIASDEPETDLDDAALLESLGIDLDAEDDVTNLTYVRSRQEIKAAEEVAQRTPCEDFARFELKFKQIQLDLKTGARQTVKYRDNAAIARDDLFILDGHTILVAEMGEPFTSDYGLMNRRLRVVYDNGTESDLLLRSLQRSLNKDKTSRRITKLAEHYGPLFSRSGGDAGKSDLSDRADAPPDATTGHIYVLRSRSDDPFISEHRSLVHKIGVTGGDVKKRIANAAKDPTYLLSDVTIVATFELMNINPKKLEALLHNFFDAARLDVELLDRFGTPVNPREWFLLSLEVIEAAIESIQQGTIDKYRYDRQSASLIRL